MANLTVIIPVFNEVNGVGDVVESVCKGLDGVDFTLIVVNDGSTDSDYTFLEEKGCRVLSHSRNKGYGAAIKTGIRATDSEWIGIIDADGTYNGDDLRRLWRRISHAGESGEKISHLPPPMIVGARTGSKREIPLIRRPAKFVLNKLANFLSEAEIPDLNSGLRIFRKDIALEYIHLFPNGFSLTSTLTLAMICDGYDVEFSQIEYHRRKGKSKIKPLKDTKDFFLTVVRTVLYFNPLKVCVPLSVMFAVVSLFILLYSHFKLERIMDGTVGVFAMMAIQIFVLGLLADLFVRRTRG